MNNQFDTDAATVSAPPTSQAATGGCACNDSERTAATRAETLRRLRRIEGQVRGIQRMLEQSRECNDVLTQLMAIRSGVDEVSLQIIDLHIERCILDGITVDEAKRAQLQQAMRLMIRVPTGVSRES